MRFKKGLVEEPPKVFQHAALDVLVAHCVEEHLIVWGKLCHSPPYDDWGHGTTPSQCFPGLLIPSFWSS